MTPRTILLQSRALVEAGWVQGHFATTYRGEDVATLDPQARRFCIAAAIGRVTGHTGWRFTLDLNARRAMAALRTAEPSGVDLPVTVFNDDPATTKWHVLRTFDRALASL